MTGPRDSVLGVEPEIVIKKFLTQMPVKFEVARGTMQVNAVVVALDDDGKAMDITTINKCLE